MSYTVLARRYRSQNFDEIIGQDHIAQTLRKSIEANRIAHAFLFCGTRGTGKTSMARILAKALNCTKTDGPNPKPCGKCSSCLAITRGEDMSVLEIDAASNTGVDNIREVIEDAYTRAPGRFKIFIIDEVHMLSKAAFNALLKTLEEPPEHVKFILATTEAEKVLPTIQSRCQRYDFRNIPSKQIAEHLKTICRDEKIKAEDDALTMIARAGAGSMRDAISLLDRLLSVGDSELSVKTIEQMLGMPRASAIFGLAGKIADGDARGVIDLVEKIISGGLPAESLVNALTEHFRNLMILIACGKDSELVEAPGLSIDDLAKQASRFDAPALSQNIVILEELRRSMRSSAAARALLDATFIRIALAAQFVSIKSIQEGSPPTAPAQKKTPEVAEVSDDQDDDLPAVGKVFEGPSLKELLKTSPTFGSEPTKQTDRPVPPANVEPVDPGDLNSVMSNLRSAIHRTNPGIDGFLMHGRLVSIEDSVATISYPNESAAAATMLDRNGKREIIQDELSRLLGASVGVKLAIESPAEVSATPIAPPPAPIQRDPSPVPAAAAAPIRITPELREELKNREPLIKALIDELGAEIVKVEQP